MMKRTDAVRFDTYDKAREEADLLKKAAQGKEGKDWKIKTIRRGSKRSPDDVYFEVVSYIGIPDKDKENGTKTKGKKAEAAN